MVRSRTTKRSLQALPAATLNRIFSYLDPHSAAAVEHTSKCFRAVFQLNDTHVSRTDSAAADIRPYKNIRTRLSGIETLPEGWTEKQFLYFMFGPDVPSTCDECRRAERSFAFIKEQCCTACAIQIALSYDRALAHLLQLQPDLAETDARDLLQLTPNMLNPTKKRWRLERCLFARDALDSIHERYRASGLSMIEFAKTQPPSLLQTALIQHIDKCYTDCTMLVASRQDLWKGATMACKMQLTRIFDQKRLPESLRIYLGKLAAKNRGKKDYRKDELEVIAQSMEQRLILIKQREDGLALKKEMEQHLQVWYVRAIKSTFKKTSEKLRAHLGVAGKQDNLLQKRLNDEINSICMATILYELWTQMDTMNEKRGKGTPRAVFDLVAAHRLADKDGKLTTSDGRHFTAEGEFFYLRCDTDRCYGTFMRAASVQVLDQHMRAHNTDRKYQLWFVPVIDADSLLLEIDSLKKYYAPRQYTTPGRFRPLRPPVTRPSHVDHNWAEHRTGDHDDDNSETGSYHSEIGMIEAEYESVDDESSSADDRMWDIGVGFYFR